MACFIDRCQLICPFIRLSFDLVSRSPYILINIIGSLWRCLSQSWHLLHHPYPLGLRWWVNQDQVIRLNKLYARTTRMHLRVFACGDNPKHTFNNNTNKRCFSSKIIKIKLTRIEKSNCEFFLDKIKH